MLYRVFFEIFKEKLGFKEMIMLDYDDVIQIKITTEITTKKLKEIADKLKIFKEVGFDVAMLLTENNAQILIGENLSKYAEKDLVLQI